MRVLILLSWTVLLLSADTDGEFLQKPKPALRPLNEIAYFNCSVSSGQIIQWNFVFSSESVASWPAHIGLLTSRGYAVYTWHNGTNSSVSVRANSENNSTKLQCYVQASNNSLFVESANLTVYSAPSPPQNLVAIPVSDRALVVQWVAPFSFGIQLQYKVLVKNLASGTLLESNWTYDNTFQYRDYSESNCSVCQFTVTAKNPAGTGNASQPLLATIPAAPQILSADAVIRSVVNATVCIIDVKTKSCDGYPVEKYFLNLATMPNASSEVLGPYYPSNGSNTKIVAQLQTDTKYIYTITSVVRFGTDTTNQQIIYTTDVQSVVITGGDHLLNVTCSFAEGTQAKGCAVCLERSGEVVYQKVPRVNETAQGVVRTEFPVDCYNVSVVDWELDGSIGSLKVNTTLIAHSTNCTGKMNNVIYGLLNPVFVVTSSWSPSSTVNELTSSKSPYTSVPALPMTYSVYTVPQSTPSGNASSMMAPETSPVGSISAGIVCAVTILAVVVVVAIVVGFRSKTKKVVISVIFPRSSVVGSTFNLPQQSSVLPKVEVHVPRAHFYPLQNQANNPSFDEFEVTHYDVIQTQPHPAINTIDSPQPYEELFRPHKTLPLPCVAMSSILSAEYAALNQFSLSHDGSRPDAASSALHEYAVLEVAHVSNQYEEVDGSVYECYVPSAGSNV